MGLARSTYYDAPATPADESEIVAHIKAICDEFEAYGYRRVGAALTDERFELWVHDTGAGIPPDDHERIFERFARSDSGERGRAGLGLAIVRTIAEAHGGDVSVTSSIGEGARFTVSFPVAPVPTIDVGHQAEHVPGGS